MTITQSAAERLVEQYWDAIYNHKADSIKESIDPDIQVTMFYNDAPKFTLKNREELLELLEKISGVIQTVIGKPTIDFELRESKLKVEFDQKIFLKNGDTYLSRGTQHWTFKQLEGKFVFASFKLREVMTVTRSVVQLA